MTILVNGAIRMKRIYTRTKPKKSEPWGKIRIKKSINKVRKHTKSFEIHQRGEIKRKEKHQELERTYSIKKKGTGTVTEELKQRLHAKTAKLRRYEERVNQYKINIMFLQNQQRVYQLMDGIRNVNNEKPNAEESKQSWKNIWDNEQEHKRNAEWLRELKAEKDNMKQNDINIAPEMIKEQIKIKKIPN